MRVAIQQPEHLPWMGFFNKMAQVDRYVLLDDVQFKKRYFENRNRIRTKQGAQWLTVPVVTKGRYRQRINEVEIKNDRDWRRGYMESLRHSYAKAPHSEKVLAGLDEIFSRPWDKLAALNTAIIQFLKEYCRVDAELMRSSEVGNNGQRGSELILELCRRIGATEYVSGPDGRTYLDLAAFDGEGIHVIYHDFDHPEYQQVHDPFMSHMSLVDFLCNDDDIQFVRNCYSLAQQEKP